MLRVEFNKIKQNWEQAVKKGNCLYQNHNFSQAAAKNYGAAYLQ